jgi:hypothetical protein
LPATTRGYELDRILFKVKKDPEFRDRFLNEFNTACLDFALSKEEKAALRDRDYRALNDLCAKDELILFLAMLSRQEKRKL